MGKGKPWQEELAELYQHVFEVVGHITAAVNPKTCYLRLMSVHLLDSMPQIFHNLKESAIS